MDLDDLPQPERETTVSPGDLDTDGDNPNSMSDSQFGLLVDRMRDDGWLGGPILTDTDGLIADGEHRMRAAQEIGLAEVPVRQYDIDDATRRLWRQQMNKNEGEHDTKRDALEYAELLDAGKSDEVDALTNAADEDLDELLAEIRVDRSSTPFYEYDTEHNVYFEDCVEGMAERLDDDSVDCVITDPPYGIDYDGGRTAFGGEKFSDVVGDADVGDSLALFRDCMAEVVRVLKPSGHVYVFTRWDVEADFAKATADHFNMKNSIVWVKEKHGLGDLYGQYAPKHERILFAVGSEGRDLNGGRPMDVLEHDKAGGGEYEHPTEKPVPLVTDLLENSTSPDDTILDPFMGSGTTAVAAIQNDRNYVGFEIDAENYQPVIERRISEAKRQMASSENQPENAEASGDD